MNGPDWFKIRHIEKIRIQIEDRHELLLHLHLPWDYEEDRYTVLQQN